MTPGTRLLEAVRSLISDRSMCGQDTPERMVRDALSGVRALYPAAHAIGERVSVVYPDERKPGYEDFTGTVVGVEFTDTGVDYRVLGDGDPDYTVVEAGFVHPSPRTLPLYRAPGVSGGPDWTVEDIVLDDRSPTWFPMDGRRAADKERRESIARLVIRSKPGAEGGACDIDYRAAALVLFQLLDDIDTLDDACRDNDAAFRRQAMVRARRREDVGASFDGYTVAFIGEAAYVEGEKRTSEPSRAEGSPGVDARLVADPSTVADETYSAPLTPDMPVTSTNTGVIPGRVQMQPFCPSRSEGSPLLMCEGLADHAGPHHALARTVTW